MMSRPRPLNFWLLRPKILNTHRDDPEAVNLLRITRGRLPGTLYDLLARAIADGWPGAIADELTHVAADLNREAAGQFFLKIVSNTKNPLNSRVTAARALGRMPERRNMAVSIVLKEKNFTVLANLLRGLRLFPWGP